MHIYATSLKYATPYENSNRNRNWKIIWFNPSFSKNVKQTLARYSLN